MSRTRKGKRGPGDEYWSKRPVSRKHGATPGRETKTRTHRLERIEAKAEAKQDCPNSLASGGDGLHSSWDCPLHCELGHHTRPHAGDGETRGSRT